MHIQDFILNYKNHPVLFIGTGISLRYLENSYTWDGLLSHISKEFTNDEEYYLRLKYEYSDEEGCDYESIAQKLEEFVKKKLDEERKGKFESINDEFYDNLKNNKPISRFKIYITRLLSDLTKKEQYSHEIPLFKKAKRNISSVITTNYDSLMEEIFEFKPLIGNDIMLSNPYGSLYKIHGCVSKPEKIIITKKDYEKFDQKYELIRAQLLSLFIHNPIIFLGYGIGDSNIKKILKTIFSYVDWQSEQAQKIKENFLLVEYENNSENLEVDEYNIDLGDGVIIKINKLKTDNYAKLYDLLAGLKLPVSAMDVRKVQTIVKNIYQGGDIKVQLIDDLEGLNNHDKVLVLGSVQSIRYNSVKPSKIASNYFGIIDEHNIQILDLIDQVTIPSSQYFPMYAFAELNDHIQKEAELKENQKRQIDNNMEKDSKPIDCQHSTVDEVLNDESIPKSNKERMIYYLVYNDNINLDECERYLRSIGDKNTSEVRKLICLYDYKRYNPSEFS